MSYYYYPQDYCRPVIDFLPGYADIAKSIVDRRYVCQGTIMVFIAISFLFYFGAKIIIHLLFKFTDIESSVINGAAGVAGPIIALLLGRYIYFIFNPLVILILAILFVLAVIRAALAYLRGGYRFYE